MRLHADQHKLARRAAAQLRAGERVGETHAWAARTTHVETFSCGVAGEYAKRAWCEPEIECSENNQTLRGFDDGQECPAARAAFDEFDLGGALPIRLQLLKCENAHASIAPLNIAEAKHDHPLRREGLTVPEPGQCAASKGAHRAVAARCLRYVADFVRSM